MLPGDFCIGITLDCHLLRTDAASGRPVPASEALSLAAAVQAIYLTATMESRRLQRVKACHELWTEIARLFDELCSAWVGADSDDPQIQWLCGRLEHFRTLAIDRTQLYEIRASERRRHALCREDAAQSFGQRNESTPTGWCDQSSPAHVYSVGRF